MEHFFRHSWTILELRGPSCNFMGTNIEPKMDLAMLILKDPWCKRAFRVPSWSKMIFFYLYTRDKLESIAGV